MSTLEALARAYDEEIRRMELRLAKLESQIEELAEHYCWRVAQMAPGTARAGLCPHGEGHRVQTARS